MVASTDIKFYVHTNTNAPQLTNNFGCMIDVLDACLVNGFGSQTVSTLTASGTTVTVTFGSAHNFMKYQVIEIAGANQTEYNGQHRILTVPNANSITFQLAAAPSVTTATGTINCSLPSLGWLKPFSGTGKAAYRSSNTLLASRPYLRVVDELDPAYTATYAKYAKVGIVEDMTDIDTMLGVQAPFDPALPNKNWVGTGSGNTAYNGWARWYYTRAQAAGVSGNQYDYSTPSNGNRVWMLIGNRDFFYILPAVTPSDSNQILYGFGSFKSLISNDNANNFLACSDYYNKANDSHSPALGSGVCATNATNATYSNLLLQRKYNSATHNNGRCGGFYAVNQSFYSASQNYIESHNGEYVSAPVFIFDYVSYSGSSLVMRGEVPLVRWLFNTSPFADMSFIAMNGEIYIAKKVATSGNTVGQVLIKLGDI